MRKGNLQLIVAIGVLLLALGVGMAVYSGGVYNNSSPTPTPTPTPVETAMTPAPTSQTIATPNSGYTVTYSELSRNETMIVIQFKLEPNSYIFQLNASSVYLTQDGARISSNTNDVVIVGTQYATLFFPVSGYEGTDYHLSSNALPPDSSWIKQ